MTRVFLALALIVPLGCAGLARAGTLDALPVTVGCGFKARANGAGPTLTLDSSDPITLPGTTCGADGIVILNDGLHKLDNSFTLDCNFLTIKGSGQGRGIVLKGPNISVFNCGVNGFGNGIVSNGDGNDIETSTVQHSVGDGFVVKNVLTSLALKNGDFSGVFISGNTSLLSGGWGFRIKGTGVESTSDSGQNKALQNTAGGFQIRGKFHEIAGQAIANGGVGIDMANKNCCTPNFLSEVDAFLNAGPGVIYRDRDDRGNCLDGTGVSCTGGVFLPEGYDPSPGAVNFGSNGGSCPQGSLASTPATATLFANKICLVVLGKPCSDKTLNNCF
jgi:hypothetical protein